MRTFRCCVSNSNCPELVPGMESSRNVESWEVDGSQSGACNQSWIHLLIPRVHPNDKRKTYCNQNIYSCSTVCMHEHSITMTFSSHKHHVSHSTPTGMKASKIIQNTSFSYEHLCRQMQCRYVLVLSVRVMLRAGWDIDVIVCSHSKLGMNLKVGVL